LPAVRAGRTSVPGQQTPRRASGQRSARRGIQPKPKPANAPRLQRGGTGTWAATNRHCTRPSSGPPTAGKYRGGKDSDSEGGRQTPVVALAAGTARALAAKLRLCAERLLWALIRRDWQPLLVGGIRYSSVLREISLGVSGTDLEMDYVLGMRSKGGAGAIRHGPTSADGDRAIHCRHEVTAVLAFWSRPPGDGCGQNSGVRVQKPLHDAPCGTSS
jgi:hypothetical protein